MSKILGLEEGKCAWDVVRGHLGFPNVVTSVPHVQNRIVYLERLSQSDRNDDGT